jgi:hypothetical protein
MYSDKPCPWLGLATALLMLALTVNVLVACLPESDSPPLDEATQSYPKSSLLCSTYYKGEVHTSHCWRL